MSNIKEFLGTFLNEDLLQREMDAQGITNLLGPLATPEDYQTRLGYLKI